MSTVPLLPAGGGGSKVDHPGENGEPQPQPQPSSHSTPHAHPPHPPHPHPHPHAHAHPQQHEQGSSSQQSRDSSPSRSHGRGVFGGGSPSPLARRGSAAAVLHNIESQLWKFLPDPHIEAQPPLDDNTFGAGKREFYRRQHELLVGFKQVDELLEAESRRRRGVGPPPTEEEKEAEGRQARLDRFCVSTSNYTNIVLFIAKLYASVVAGSLAIIAATLDSLLDLLAGGILWYTSHSMARNDPAKYPAGKKRMQPVGIVVFAAIMATLGLQILVQGVEQLTEGPGDRPAEQMSDVQLLWVGGLLAGATGVKLLLFLLCRMSSNDIVQAYAMDHIFDVVTNSVSLASALLGSRVAWWVDPVGAIIIAIYTIANWSNTVLENASSLVGMAAPVEVIGRLTYVVFNHDPRIVRIDTVRAWTFGSQYLVEVDIELPGDMRLREAHGIGETLQNKLEALPDVDRAFVHLDYESHHKPEHSGGLIDCHGHGPPVHLFSHLYSTSRSNSSSNVCSNV